MGLFALAVPALAMRFGRKYLVIFALISLSTSALLRAIEGVPGLLFVSAFLAGVGIAFAGGLIPGIIREQLPLSIGRATSIWTTALAGGAALGGAFTVPLANWLGSWSLALAFWATPAIIALVVWTVIERRSDPHDRPGTIVRIRELPWRNKIAWALALNMTFNSIISQVLAAFILGGMALRMKHRRTLFLTAIGLTSLALFAIAWLPDFAPWLTLLLFGFFLSGGFAMTLGLLSEYSRDYAGAARLTAMAFFITYTVAAAGPLIAGALLDFFDSWPLVFTVLGIAALLQLLTVLPLRRNVYVD